MQRRGKAGVQTFFDPAEYPHPRDADRGVAFLLFFIFAVALAFRLWGIFNPLLDFHSWRQTLTAMVARNFVRDGMNILTPRLDDLTPHFEFEFPIFTYLVALLYQLFGVQEWLGRLVAVLFSMGTLAYVYALGKRYLDRPAALTAAFLFAILPMAVFYSRVFMPESAMLFFSVAGLYHFGGWIEKGEERDYWLSALGICAAVLVKLPTLYLILPLAYLSWKKFGWKFLGKGRLWLFLLMILLPTLLWYGHWDAQAKAYYGGRNLWLQNDKLLSAEHLLSLRFYRLIFITRLGEKMFAFSGFPLFLAGICLCWRNPRERVLLIWLASVFFYFLIVARGNYVHEYYQLPVLPVGCLLAGKAVSAIVHRARQRKIPLSRDPLVWIVVLLLLFIPFNSVWLVHRRLKLNLSTLHFAREVASRIPATDRLLVQASHQTDLLYYADRRGWYVGTYVRLSRDQLEAYRKKGARYYINRATKFEKTNPLFNSYLRENYSLLTRGRNGIIFDLRQPLHPQEKPNTGD